jgi:adenylosuccinate lyase
VPITFGFALSGYVSRLGNSISALNVLSDNLYGKFSGAVGAYNALSLFVDDPFEFEESVLRKVGLKPAEYSSQIVPPEVLIRAMDELAISAGIMANIGHDMRHLQRSEIGEIREQFEKGQTGSSTMAHKTKPLEFRKCGKHEQASTRTMPKCQFKYLQRTPARLNRLCLIALLRHCTGRCGFDGA